MCGRDWGGIPAPVTVAQGGGERHLVGLGAPLGEGLGGVENEVEQDLPQRRPIAVDRRHLPVTLPHARAVLDLIARDGQRLVEQIVERERFAADLGAAREPLEIPDHVADAVEAHAAFVQQRRQRGQQRREERGGGRQVAGPAGGILGEEAIELAHRLLDVHRHVGERVVDLVSHARRQPAQRREALGLLEPPEELAPLDVPQDPADRAEQRIGAEGLAQIGLGVDGRRLRAAVGRHRQHGNPRQPRIALLNGAELPAVHDRHPQVEHDEIGRAAGAELLQRLASVLRGRHGVPFLFQDPPQRLPDTVIVLDEENALTRGLGPARAPSLRLLRRFGGGLPHHLEPGEARARPIDRDVGVHSGFRLSVLRDR
jgi:hypothetical protein